MGISVTQHNEHVILYQFEHPWSLDDLDEAQTTLNALMEDIDGKVTVIVDYSAGGSPPQRLISRFTALMGNQTGMDRMQRIIAVGTNSGMVRAATAIFSRVFHRLDVVDTLDEAYALLEGESS
jgi:hypothetical protein